MTKRTMIIAALSAFVAFAAGYAMLGQATTGSTVSRSGATSATATQLDATQLAELLGAAGPQPRVVVLDGPAATLETADYQKDRDHDDYDDHDDDDDDRDHRDDRKSDGRLASSSSSDKNQKDRDHD